MRIARIQTPEGPRYVAEVDGAWAGIEDPFATKITFTGDVHDPATATLLAPVEPKVIIGMLHNTGEADRELPPQAFLKSARTAVGPGDPVLLDPAHGQVKGEGELTIVVGRTARHLTSENALDHVLGWTIANDITGVDQAGLDDKLTQAKNGDGYTPIGPWIETDPDWRDAAIRVSLDGRDVAAGSSAGLARNAVEVLCYVTSHLTLGPGDILLTGAPETAWPIEAGQMMEITIDGIGTLSNPIQSLDGRS